MAGKVILITIILISGVIFFVTQVGAEWQPAATEVVLMAPEPAIKATAPSPAAPPSTSQPERYIVDESSQWTTEELAVLNQVLQHTFRALAEAGLDGRVLLADYRFRRVAGEYIDEALGLVGLVNHDTRVISLADAAFVRLGGFYIYHELGHALDHQLGRALSEQFHAQVAAAAGTEIAEENGAAVGDINDGAWQTTDGYWLRAQAHDDREEATADAFALWVGIEQAGMHRPIFAGTPLDADYGGISSALADAMLAIHIGKANRS